MYRHRTPSDLGLQTDRGRTPDVTVECLMHVRVTSILIFCASDLFSMLDCVRVINFYRASYASPVLAVIVCLSVRPSVTSRSCTKMAKLRITIRTAYDSPGTLVF